jgi:hypothetical protein
MTEKLQTNEERFNELKPWALENLRTLEEGCTIVFTKKDGTQREMHCTLFPGNIPVDKQPKTESEKDTSTSGSALRVFDLEKKEWRSFRWDSVKQVTIGI